MLLKLPISVKLRRRYQQVSTVLACMLCLSFAASIHAENWAMQWEQMIQEILDDVHRTVSYTGRDALAPSVIDAMRNVPRHKFVPDEVESAAYFIRPLPIGSGQTISQPYIVALMTDLLDPEKDHKVLEIGTGSGYQAAVLAKLVKEVHTIEIISELGHSAHRRLQKLGYQNIYVHIGDGYYGWSQDAPYDSIIVTATSEEVPAPLIEQLKPGGKMVIPLGRQYSAHNLVLIEKSAAGHIAQRNVLPVQFVPFTRKN